MSLHPDKILALSTIAGGTSPTEREPIESGTVEQRAIDAAKTRQMTALPKEPGAIDDLAYAVRDTHWANHLARLKSRTNPSKGEPTKPPTPTVVFQLPTPTQGGGENLG